MSNPVRLLSQPLTPYPVSNYTGYGGRSNPLFDMTCPSHDRSLFMFCQSRWVVFEKGWFAGDITDASRLLGYDK
eukprot:scaffold421367_cov62-Attheya_sp.AAC.2